MLAKRFVPDESHEGAENGISWKTFLKKVA